MNDWIIKMDSEGSLWYKGCKYVKEEVPLATPQEESVIECGDIPHMHVYSYELSNDESSIREVCLCGYKTDWRSLR